MREPEPEPSHRSSMHTKEVRRKNLHTHCFPATGAGGRRQGQGGLRPLLPPRPRDRRRGRNEARCPKLGVEKKNCPVPKLYSLERSGSASDRGCISIGGSISVLLGAATFSKPGNGDGGSIDQSIDRRTQLKRSARDARLLRSAVEGEKRVHPQEETLAGVAVLYTPLEAFRKYYTG